MIVINPTGGRKKPKVVSGTTTIPADGTVKIPLSFTPTYWLLGAYQQGYESRASFNFNGTKKGTVPPTYFPSNVGVVYNGNTNYDSALYYFFVE